MKQHSMSCTFPEGCSCGATEWNAMEAEIKRLRSLINQKALSSMSDLTVGDIIYPTVITENMLRFASTEDLWHYAANLNAMIQYGYCNKCGLTPDGCTREGCRANVRNKERQYNTSGIPPKIIK